MTGKAIFITGAGSGIGRAVAVHFAERGWFVGLADINESGMQETAALLPTGRSCTHRLDVRDRAAWDAALSAFSETAGQIDVVHNNAGIAHGGPLVGNTQAEIDQLIDVNFRGAAYGAQAAYPFLKDASPGACLLNTASAAAIYGSGGLAIYSATKFAVRALTEALDAEWASDGIRVCSLMPSFIDTPLLHGPTGANSNVSKRDAVVAAGLEFTPVEEVAEAAWNAVHGQRVHTLVGKTARQMNFAVKWLPKYMRKRARNPMHGAGEIEMRKGIGMVLLTGAVAIAVAKAQAQPAPAAPTSAVPGWSELIERLRDLPDRMLAKLPEAQRRDPQVQQEVARLALEALGSSALSAVGADGDHPQFLPTIGQVWNIGQPNADTVYRGAKLTPGGTYRLRGERGSLRMAVVAQTGPRPAQVPGQTAPNLGPPRPVHDFNKLKIDSQGRFDVMLGPARPAGWTGEWWKLDPTTDNLLLRLVSADWPKEREPTISIERVDHPSSTRVLPPRH